MFAKLIHEITGPLIPRAIPGRSRRPCGGRGRSAPAALAIAASGTRPSPSANGPRSCSRWPTRLLGHGQLSLAKYLLIVAGEDSPELDIKHVPDFLRHVLERIDWRRDLHFQTSTTIDTLDYSGPALHQGSKVVMAAAGPVRRTLPVAMDSRIRLPTALGFHSPSSACRESWWSKARSTRRRMAAATRRSSNFAGRLPGPTRSTPSRCRGGRRQRVCRAHA